MDKEKVMFSISHLKIKTAQFVLSEAGIASFPIDKMDSAHAGLFGDIQLYVDENVAVEARKILVEQEIL